MKIDFIDFINTVHPFYETSAEYCPDSQRIRRRTHPDLLVGPVRLDRVWPPLRCLERQRQKSEAENRREESEVEKTNL